METLTQFSEANEKAASAITRTGQGTREYTGRPVADGLTLGDPWFQRRSQRASRAQITGSRVRDHLARPPKHEGGKRARPEI